MKKKAPLYVLPHGIEVIGEYPPNKHTPYWRCRIRPHPFFPGVREVSNGIQVHRSRAILASKLGRALTPKDHAHHGPDGRSTDTPDNLTLLTAAEHNRHHKIGWKQPEESKRKISAGLRRAVAEGRRSPPKNLDQDGEKNRYAKLTAMQVAQIRSDARTHTEIAKNFNVSRRNIGMIKANITWRSVL